MVAPGFIEIQELLDMWMVEAIASFSFTLVALENSNIAKYIIIGKLEDNFSLVEDILSKADVVRKGTELGVPYELTWSCYEGGEFACGTCDSCILRLNGFAEAQQQDPIQYMSVSVS